MRAREERLLLPGAAGNLEVVVATPEQPRGLALIAHPHPLYGGTLDNKVVQTLARACVQCGWRAVRFNFRGVGASAGQYDHGQGEQDDLLAVVAQQAAADQALLLAGFSFGAFVASQAIARLHPQRALAGAVLVGTAASRFDVAPLPPALHAQTLVVHGEHDETVPLTSVMDWARPQLLPVTVVPGGGHFFHGQLPLLKGLVERHLRAL